jgi:prevent-host-death family protein
MITFTSKDAKNKLGDVFRAAESEDVVITNHGKPIVRVISIKNVEKMKSKVNSHDLIDKMKHIISCEVLSRFSINTIRNRSIENLNRWKSQGTWSGAYDEWFQILESKNDQNLISSMIGMDQRSNRLRQSMPYVGLLDQHLVREIHEKNGS